MRRLELATIPDRELAAGALAGIDHRLTAFRRHLHRLFAEHVLAGARRLDRMLGVQGVRCDDIDDVDVRVLRHAIHRLVRIDASVGEAVLSFPPFALFRASGDDGGEPTVRRALERRGDLIGAQTPETDDREPERLLTRKRPGHRAARAKHGHAGYGDRGALEEVPARRVVGWHDAQ